MREERALLHLDERTRGAIDPADARGELPALWRAFGEAKLMEPSVG